MRPSRRITTWSQVRSTSESTCDETSTVAPRARAASIQPRASRTPSGSRPEVGSSSSSTLGPAEQRLREARALRESLRESVDGLVQAVAHAGRLGDGVDLAHEIARRRDRRARRVRAGSAAASCRAAGADARAGSRRRVATPGRRDRGRAVAPRRASVARSRAAGAAPWSCPRRSRRAIPPTRPAAPRDRPTRGRGGARSASKRPANSRANTARDPTIRA